MPFIDLNTKDADSFLIPTSDITIIGAGAAGILLAIKLANQGKSVVLFESGHFFEDEKRQELNEVVQTGKVMQNVVWGRKRAIGGTTIAWGGQSLPFTSIDFEKREWVQNSGWPISYNEMDEYYKEANTFMGIDILNYNNDIFPKISLKNPGIDPSIFDFHVSKWATQPNFFIKHKVELENKITVIYNSQVTSIHKTGDRVDTITVYNFVNSYFTCSVNTLIISCGTIETSRLLLNSNIGNHSGWLGKTFMEHPCIEIGTIKSKNSYELQRYFNTHVWKGHKYSVRLTLSRKFQQENKLLNCSTSVMFQLPTETFDPYSELKAFKKDLKFSRIVKLSGSVKSILKTTWAYITHKFYFKPNTIAKLVLMIEQEPIKESYISLSDKKDKFQILGALINWNISLKTWDTVIKTSTALKNQIENLNLGNVELYAHIKEDTPNWNKYLSDVCHHMGGTRISSTPEDGVVNKNLQIWGISNLYICSCSVFPTSSHSNPTLTLLALGLKLCNHLNEEK